MGIGCYFVNFNLCNLKCGGKTLKPVQLLQRLSGVFNNNDQRGSVGEGQRMGWKERLEAEKRREVTSLYFS